MASCCVRFGSEKTKRGAEGERKPRSEFDRGPVVLNAAERSDDWAGPEVAGPHEHRDVAWDLLENDTQIQVGMTVLGQPRR